jgi:ATP-dependent DNA ligase
MELSMYAFEAVKSRFENLTGLAQPSAREVKKRIKRSKPRAKRFDDNNLIPNNPSLPLIHYRKVVSLTGLSDPAALFEHPSGPGWTHELKHDGYRLQIHIRDGRVRLYTMNGADWSKRYPRIVEAAARIKVSSVMDAPYKSGPSKTWLKIKNPKAPAATRAVDGTF